MPAVSVTETAPLANVSEGKMVRVMLARIFRRQDGNTHYSTNVSALLIREAKKMIGFQRPFILNQYIKSLICKGKNMA